VIDFTVTDEQRAVGAEARAFLAEHFPPELEEHVYRSGTSHDVDWSAALAERGWIAATWPESAGGSGQSRTWRLTPSLVLMFTGRLVVQR